MYIVTLMIEDMNRKVGSEVVSNVTLISDIKSMTPQELKPVVEKLSQLACQSQFMRKGIR